MSTLVLPGWIELLGTQLTGGHFAWWDRVSPSPIGLTRGVKVGEGRLILGPS